jgi:DNA-binding winged helix-turn-helix (wHTH) protein/TolB-like protein
MQPTTWGSNEVTELFRGDDAELDARARRVELAREPDFTIGSVTVQPSLRKITGPQGEAMLEPKVMQVLVALGTPMNTILSRDDLIERCWDGRVVGDTSINRVISLLRSGFRAVAGEEVVVENVPKVGYRLIAGGAVPEPDALSVAPEPVAQADGAGARRFIWIGAGIIVVLALIAAMFALQPRNAQTLPPLRVAMLPLETGDGVDPMYSKGLEAELRSQFAKVGQIEVTASESAALLSEQGMDEMEIGRRLNAEFVWAGTLTSAEDRITLDARLIDVSGERVEWRQTFSSAPDAGQFLPLRTARAMSETLGRPVSARVPKVPVNAAGYRLYLTALGLIKSRGLEERRTAYSLLGQVTAENPQFADGWAGLAKASFLYPAESIEDAEDYRARALELARHALSIDEDAVDALKVVGMLDEDAERRLDMLNRAVALDPGDSEAWFWLSIVRSEFLLMGEDPLEPVDRMVKIDPLWPASWRASDLAAEFGDMESALRIEKDILSAAVTPSQRFLAEARIARLKGDLSQFIALSKKAAPTQSAAERRYGSILQNRMIRFLLRLPIADQEIAARGAPVALVAMVVNGDLPERAQIEAEGLSAAQVWELPELMLPALPLYLRDGREDELLALYDETFDDHAAFVAFAEGTGQEAEIIPSVSPYLAVALRSVGREDEAAQHLQSAEAQLARWKAADTTWIKPVLWDLQLAAVKRDDARAIRAIRRLPDYGWPFTMGHIDTASVGLATDDPLYDRVRTLPEARAVLDPITAQLAREREEIRALDF